MKEEVDFVKWFSELNKNSTNIAGGKGANLSEIFNLGVPVPQGFCVTAQAYNYFIEKAGLKNKIQTILNHIDYEDTKKLDEITIQIRTWIVESEFPEEMEEEILEAYETLCASKLKNSGSSALEILKKSTDQILVAVRSSATSEDSADASFAGQQDSFVNVKGNSELIKNIKKCFASLFNSRAVYYRHKKGFEHSKTSISVVVQKMIDSDKSGVIFSKDPSYTTDQVIIESVWGLGEGIVSGKITPDRYLVSRELEIEKEEISEKKIAIIRDETGLTKTVKLKEERSRQKVLTNFEIRKLAEIAIKLEKHYQKPQDIEFAIESEAIFIVQTRPITTIAGRIEKRESTIKGEIILSGIPASPGIASGKVKIVEKMADLDKIQKGDVLVTTMTNPDMVVTMQRCSAIVTDEGGMTAHAAIVSREMGIPCVVGTKEATLKLKDGVIVTVDGSSGKIYRGKVSETEKKEVLPVTAKTKTKIKVIVDLPTFAERASKTNLKSVGLTRIEGIIAESGKHPNYFLQNKKFSDYEKIIFDGVEKISRYFDEIWVRTSDIRSDEYENLEGAPKEKEANPMLGMHGIRYGIKHPEILKAELRALKKISDKGKIIGVLIPQVILVEEVKKVKDYLREIDFTRAKIGVMIETPAAVQLIKDLCNEKIDFISFGTNDLTQYMLAVDRGNEEVQDLYNEMHPSVLYQLEYVIRVCKRNNVASSICGQSASRKEMVKFLVEKNIDSLSVNADVAKEISDYVAQLEGSSEKEIETEESFLIPISEEELTPEFGGNVEIEQTVAEETKEEFDNNPEFNSEEEFKEESKIL